MKKKYWIVIGVVAILPLLIAAEIVSNMRSGSVQESPFSKVPSVLPERPVPSNKLLDDKTLALAAEQIPAVAAAWQADVKQRARAIRSLWSEDFSDLQFLKPILAGKRIVQLGESTHGAAEFNWMKLRLIKFLHQEMGYDVLAFESSMPGIYFENDNVTERPPVKVMRDTLFGTWHTEEVVELFQYVQAQRKDGRTLALAGFDSQDSSASSSEIVARLLRESLAEIDPALLAALAKHEARLQKYYNPGPFPQVEAGESLAFYRTAASTLSANRERLSKQFRDPARADLVIQVTKSRMALVEQLQSAGGYAIRDRAMADNLDFLLDKAYPGRKIIVWAHNAHVAHTADFLGVKPMGAWLAERRRAELYTVGLVMGRGVASTVQPRQAYEIAAPPANSLEGVLASAGLKMAFVDFSKATSTPESAWIHETINTRDWGVMSRQTVPFKAFDGVIYIDSVTPPKYQ